MAEERIKQNQDVDVGTFNGLPVDLVRVDILTLLPVETLIILRAVCKSFLSIIDDRSFVTSHLRRFPGNLSKSRFLTVDRSCAVYEFSPPYSNGKMVCEYDRQEPMSSLNWCLNASLDGVLLFVSRGSVDGRSGYVAAELLNPSIKKRRRLCLPSELVIATQFGLGFDPSSSDYKVIATTSFPEDQAWIYSVKARCWTQIISSGGIGGGAQTICSEALAFNGGVAWVEFSSTIDNRHRLVRFDFATGRFRYAEEMAYDESAWFRFLLDGGSSVSVWAVDAKNESAWVLENDTAARGTRYKIGPGEMVVTNRIFLVDETSNSKSKSKSKDGESVRTYHTWGQGSVDVNSYDVKKKTVSNRSHVSVGIQHDCIGVYRESLVLLH